MAPGPAPRVGALSDDAHLMPDVCLSHTGALEVMLLVSSLYLCVANIAKKMYCMNVTEDIRELIQD